MKRDYSSFVSCEAENFACVVTLVTSQFNVILAHRNRNDRQQFLKVYSVRKACMGSIAAARRAGSNVAAKAQKPKTTIAEESMPA